MIRNYLISDVKLDISLFTSKIIQLDEETDIDSNRLVPHKPYILPFRRKIDLLFDIFNVVTADQQAPLTMLVELHLGI